MPSDARSQSVGGAPPPDAAAVQAADSAAPVDAARPADGPTGNDASATDAILDDAPPDVPETDAPPPEPDLPVDTLPLDVAPDLLPDVPPPDAPAPDAPPPDAVPPDTAPPDTAPPDAPPALVKVTDDVEDEGQKCFVIETPSATYYYQKVGAGFSSILDREGHDWVGYKPTGGFDGAYRGIPNLGPCCHPGYPTADEGVPMTSRLVSHTNDRAVINSVSADGAWDVTWEFRPDRATLTVNKAKSYYRLLYEGTPGGAVGPEDFWVQANGTRHTIEDKYDGDLPAPEWVYFADGKLGRSLLLVHHEDDNLSEQYWNGTDMVVWGFARNSSDPLLLDEVPQRMTLALVDSTTHPDLEVIAENVLK